MATWDEVQAACAPVLADLERTHPGEARLERDTGDLPMPAEGWLRDTRTGSATGVFLLDGTPLEQVLDATEKIQEAAFDVVWGAWPECPEHPHGHPLTVQERDAAAVWVCDRTGQAVARVGELPG